MGDRTYIDQRLREIMRPVDFKECPDPPNRCGCGPRCSICGFRKHYSVHGGCLNDPSRVFDHYYAPMRGAHG